MIYAINVSDYLLGNGFQFVVDHDAIHSVKLLSIWDEMQDGKGFVEYNFSHFLLQAINTYITRITELFPFFNNRYGYLN